jgi:hypothetical protein
MLFEKNCYFNNYNIIAKQTVPDDLETGVGIVEVIDIVWVVLTRSDTLERVVAVVDEGVVIVVDSAVDTRS